MPVMRIERSGSCRNPPTVGMSEHFGEHHLLKLPFPSDVGINFYSVYCASVNDVVWSQPSLNCLEILHSPPLTGSVITRNHTGYSADTMQAQLASR